MPNARLTRSDTDQFLAGVCGGIAAYLSVDSALVRVAFVVLLLASGIGIPMYIILWVIMPSESSFNKFGARLAQDNFDDMRLAVPGKESRLSRPGTIGVILVSLGVFFLFSSLKLHATFLIPVLLIGAGVYWLVRQNQS